MKLSDTDTLLASMGYSSNLKPELVLATSGRFDSMPIKLGKPLTLRFDTSVRFCTGWRDIASGSRHTCPDAATVDKKHEQCIHCMRKTGFNPAFYNSDTVSPQQLERNSQPHVLYLAHFGAGTLKVGMTHEKRGIKRLLEQGARSAILLASFPTANVARKYEASIASMPGIQETVTSQKKIELLELDFNKTKSTELLHQTHNNLQNELAVEFDNQILYFDEYYFGDKPTNFASIHDISKQALISGNVIGTLGSILCAENDGRMLAMPLKKFLGYKITTSNTTEPLDLPPLQTSLF